MQTEDDTLILLTEPTKLQAAREWLQSKGIEPQSAELVMLPNETMTLSPEQQAQVEAFIEMAEDQDDVENVFHNLAIN